MNKLIFLSRELRQGQRTQIFANKNHLKQDKPISARAFALQIYRKNDENPDYIAGGKEKSKSRKKDKQKNGNQDPVQQLSTQMNVRKYTCPGCLLRILVDNQRNLFSSRLKHKGCFWTLTAFVCFRAWYPPRKRRRNRAPSSSQTSEEKPSSCLCFLKMGKQLHRHYQVNSADRVMHISWFISVLGF